MSKIKVIKVGKIIDGNGNLINNGLSKKILILDLDVHQGNGTAEIFKNNNQVFTVSFHGKNNYPFRKEISNFDYGFEDKTEDI